MGQGNVSNFGTWSLSDDGKTLTEHVESSFFGRADGTDLKYTISLTGDELKSVDSNGFSSTWKKVPPPQQVAAVPAAAQQQQQKTLKQQVQGAWNLISCDAKVPICANPTGSVSYNGNGRYTIVVAAKNRPTPASVASTPGQRDKMTPEEYKAVAQAFAAQFVTWSVNEADKTITTHKEDGLIPTSTDGKATIVSVTADELKTNGLLGNAVSDNA
jgi:hypothetical protein